jgi:hypothetical protein
LHFDPRWLLVSSLSGVGHERSQVGLAPVLVGFSSLHHQELVMNGLKWV